MISNLNNKVVYVHSTKAGVPFYVGSGTEKRPYSLRNRNKWWKHVVDKHGYTILIFKNNLTLEESIFWEKYLVDLIGRKDLGKGTLVNLCDPSISGMSNPSKETRDKIGLVHKGRKLTDEHIEKLRITSTGRKANLGKKHSDETKLKISLSKKGKPSGRLGLPGTNLGKTFTEEHRKKISDSHKGKTFSTESKLKMSQSMKGRIPWNKGKKKIQL